MDFGFCRLANKFFSKFSVDKGALVHAHKPGYGVV